MLCCVVMVFLVATANQSPFVGEKEFNGNWEAEMNVSITSNLSADSPYTHNLYIITRMVITRYHNVKASLSLSLCVCSESNGNRPDCDSSSLPGDVFCSKRGGDGQEEECLPARDSKRSPLCLISSLTINKHNHMVSVCIRRRRRRVLHLPPDWSRRWSSGEPNSQAVILSTHAAH